MKHFYLFALLACTVVLGGVAWAQPLQDIQFPIAELGNCESKDACASYCDEPAHGQQCFEFGKKLGLISETEAKLLETLPEQRGPGGCATDQVCREYCSQEANFEECSEFGKLHGLITDQDVEKGREAVERRREIQETLSQQGGPGACASEQECKNYCEDVEHAQECVAFAEQHNLISPEDAMRIKKAGFAGGPGGCKGPEQCRAYCEEPSHQNECIDFAEKNGFMSVEDASRARKFAGKTGPGGCKGEECRTVCGKPENARMCIEHAEKEGLLPPEELQRAKKFLEVAEQGGPGGCKGPEECQAYCSQESNQEECFSFGKKQGLIRPEDEQRFQAGQKIHQVMQESGGPGGCRAEEDCRAYCVDPLHVEECIAFGATHGGVPEGEVREMLKQFQEKRFEVQGDFQGFRPPEDFRRFEEEALGRFEQFKLLEQEFRGREFGPPQGFGPAGPQPGPGKFVGPGGCTSPSECIAYCAENKSACFDFKDLGDPSRAHEGNMPPGEFRPQLQNNLILEFKEGELPKFDSPEEQKKFFQENFHEFRQELPGNISEEQRREFLDQKFQGFQGRPFPGETHPGQGEQQGPFPGPQGEFPREPNMNPDMQPFPSGDQQFRQEPFREPFQQMPAPEFQHIQPQEFSRPPEGSAPMPDASFQQFQQPPPIQEAPPVNEPPPVQESPPAPEGGSMFDAVKAFFKNIFK